VTRIVSNTSNCWKVPVVVENRPRNAAIAAQAVARSAPDGHTTPRWPDAAFTSTPFLSKNKLALQRDEFRPSCGPCPHYAGFWGDRHCCQDCGDLVALSNQTRQPELWQLVPEHTRHASMEDFKQRTGPICFMCHTVAQVSDHRLLSGQISQSSPVSRRGRTRENGSCDHRCRYE